MNEEAVSRLFLYMGKTANNCPKCGEKLVCTSIKIGFGNEIIGTYACKNEECRSFRHRIRSYRRLLPTAAKEFVEENLTEKDICFIERQRSAAMAAVIRCSKCGYKRKYIESAFKMDGKLLHKFRCDNENCIDYGKSIKTEFTEWDCENILGKVRKRNVCVICGHLSGAKVFCEKEGGFVCESHCHGCEFLENRTSMTHCVWFARVGAAEAAKKGLEAFEKALRIHREI